MTELVCSIMKYNKSNIQKSPRNRWNDGHVMMCFNTVFSSSVCPLTPACHAFSNILDNNVLIFTAASMLVAASNTKSKSLE